MAHYALLNQSNVVVQVITGCDETEIVDGIESWENYYSEITGLKAVRTSYNTQYVYEYEFDDNDPPKVIKATIVGSIHMAGGTPFRGKYAAIGDVWTGTEFRNPKDVIDNE